MAGVFKLLISWKIKCTGCENELPDNALVGCDINKNKYWALYRGISPTEIKILILKNGRTLSLPLDTI